MENNAPVNTIAVDVAVQRLESNRAQILSNHETATSLNADLEVKAINEELARRAAKAKGEERKDVIVKGYKVPSDNVSCYDEAIDRLTLLAGSEIEEDYISRSLLAPVEKFDPEASVAVAYSVKVSTSEVINSASKGGLVR